MECLKYVCIDSSIQTTTEWMTQQQYAYSDGNLSQTGSLETRNSVHLRLSNPAIIFLLQERFYVHTCFIYLTKYL